MNDRSGKGVEMFPQVDSGKARDIVAAIPRSENTNTVVKLIRIKQLSCRAHILPKRD